jgi:hypothetical protein
MNRAGTAFSDSTTKLGAREFQIVSYDPEQGHIIRDIYLVVFAVDIERNHDVLLSYSDRQFPQAWGCVSSIRNLVQNRRRSLRGYLSPGGSGIDFLW